jgi:uncharacterized protein (TIGR03437 family)
VARAGAGVCLGVFLSVLSLGATSTSVSLNFSGTGSGQPNTVNATGTGTFTPFGAAALTFTSGGTGPETLTASLVITLNSGGTLSASCTQATYTGTGLSGQMTVTGGTGELAGAAGSFAFAFTVPPGTVSTGFTFTLTGSGTVNVNLQSSTVTLPDAVVGVPYSANITQGLSTIPSDAQLVATGNLPPGLTLAPNGLLSGVPSQTGTFSFTAGYSPFNSLTVSVNVDANPAPPIAVTPSILNFSATQGASTVLTQSILVANSGGSQQTIAASASTSSGGNWLQVSPSSQTVGPFTSVSASVTVDAGKLAPGTYLGSIAISAAPANQAFSVAVLLTVGNGQAELQLSSSGLFYEAVAGGTSPPSQKITVLNSGGTSLDYSVSASVTSDGPAWLVASPNTGTLAPGASATISVAAITDKLSANVYYGQILISSPGAANSPRVLTAVLNISASNSIVDPTVSPTGLIFVGTAGGSDPASQTISLNNPSLSDLTFSSATFFINGSKWYTALPASGVVSAGSSATVTVQPQLAGLAAGVYIGKIALTFGANSSTRDVAVVLIVIPNGVPRTAHVASPACTPTKLIPVFTQLGENFTTVAAWPAPLEVTVVDDCGNFLTEGDVVASFSDGDPSLPLTSVGGGVWSATWQPSSSVSQVVVTANAQELAPLIEGTQSIGGSLQANPVTPSINTGGVVSAAKGGSNQPLAPGAFTSIYGSHLSAGQNPALSLPLANQLGATQVVLGGRALPLQFAADGQVNAVIPYDVPANTTQQLIVANGPALSVPQTVVIAPAQPAVFAQADGSGVIFGVAPGTSAQIPVDPDHPVSEGYAIVIYCAGLGPVDPAVEAGSAAPSAPPAQTTNPVTVTIGGKDAQVFFGGLVGGFAGLYQVNAYVPAGITPGAAVPLIVTVAGFESAPVTIAVK